MVKKLIVRGVLVYVAALTILTVALIEATPGPDNQAFIGVNIGPYDQPGGSVGFSGRRMTCTDPVSEPFASTCVIEIEGQVLEISAQRGPPIEDERVTGTCAASYAGRMWPCHLGWGNSVMVAWYAMIDDPLGLTPQQLDELRMRFPIENAGDTFFTVLVFLVATLNVLVYGMVAGQWMPLKWRNSILVWTAHAGASLVIWLLSAAFWGWLTFNLWD